MYASGIVGDALSRDGTQPSITLLDFGNNNSLNLENGAITIEAWVKSSNFGDDFRHLIDNVDGYALSIFEGRLAMLGPDFWWTPIDTTGPNTGPLTNPVLSPGAWHYVAGTYDGSKQALYVDGQLVAYRNTSASVPAGQGNIGIAGYGGGGFDYAFRGLIDELRVFDYARPAAAIAADYEDLTSSSLIRVRITDSLGNPVSRLTLYEDNDPSTVESGWPLFNLDDQVDGKNVLANPLTVTLNVSDASLVARRARLQLSDPTDQARFYVFDEPAGCVPTVELHTPGTLEELFLDKNPYSYKSYKSECDLAAGATGRFEWKVWVQPSVETSLAFAARLFEPKVDSNNNPIEVILGITPTKLVTAQQAAIYPIVFIPGLGATNPPQFYPNYHDIVATDGLLAAGSTVGYDNMYHTLERLGYERNRTYFLFPYDWLLATPYSAQRLRNDMLLPVSAEIATTVPWVAGYGSTNGQDVKFDLIGHSTGNLVARSYIQGDDTLWAGHVRRFVSLAGPHKGLPKGFAMLEGVSVEGTCNPLDPNFDIACLAFLHARSRAEVAGYGTKRCLPWPLNRVCTWDWGTEDKYLFIHDPFSDLRAPGSVTGFLPTYTEAAYLTNASGDFPYGRLANPLFETESSLGSVLGGGTITDPYTDNDYAMTNLRQRYPDQIDNYSTAYYGLNSLEKMQLLFDRIGDPATNSNNVCLIYGKGEGTETPLSDPTPLKDTRVQIDVSEPQTEPPYWLTGARDNGDADRFGLGDRFVPGVSGGATDIWMGTLLGPKNENGQALGYDLDKDLQSTGKTAEHGALVGYGITHKHIAECLIGTTPAFLENGYENGTDVTGTVASVKVLAAPARIRLADIGLLSHALLISVRGPVELTLTDAEDHRLGYNPDSIQSWAEIPEGLYTYDADLGFKYLLIWSPNIEDYTLTITGSGAGDYSVLGSYYDSSGMVNLLYNNGQIAPGASETILVTVPTQAVDVPQPPDVSVGPDVTANEGEAVAFSGKVTDINPGDTHTYHWDFGDGSTAEGTLAPIHTFADNGEYSVTLNVSDSAGFETSDTLKVTIRNLPPIVNAGNDITTLPNQAVTFTGSFADLGSGDTHTILWSFGDGTTAIGTLTPTHVYTSPDIYAVTLTATDDDGDVGNDTLTVNVQYPFTGFFQPVDNLPILNTVKAGSAIPVKFSLGGNYGLSIFAIGYPSSSTVTCGSIAEDAVEETVTAGGSSLSYNAITGQYIYVWKTDKAWANTCRTLVVKLDDGTYHKANFKFNP